MGTQRNGMRAKVGWREAYVERQLANATYALHLGAVGAARAALRVLSAEDFEAPHEASHHLRAVRNHDAEPEEIAHAVRRLCALQPSGARAPASSTG